MRCRDPAPRNRRSTHAAASLADRRVGLARLVRVRHGPRPVHSRLQPHPRRRQRIVVGLTEALVEQRRHRLVEGEVRRGLARRRRIHAHEARRPRTGRHNDGLRTQSVERDRLALVLDRLDPRSLAQVRARSGRCSRAAPAARGRRTRSRRRAGRARSRRFPAGSGSVARSRPGPAPRTARRTRPAHPGVACQSPRSIVPGWSSSARPQPASSSCQSGYASCASRTQRSSG